MASSFVHGRQMWIRLGLITTGSILDSVGALLNEIFGREKFVLKRNNWLSIFIKPFPSVSSLGCASCTVHYLVWGKTCLLPQNYLSPSWWSDGGEQAEGKAHIAGVHQQSLLTRGVHRRRNPGWICFWPRSHHCESLASSKILWESLSSLLCSLFLRNWPEQRAAWCPAPEALPEARSLLTMVESANFSRITLQAILPRKNIGCVLD